MGNLRIYIFIQHLHYELKYLFVCLLIFKKKLLPIKFRYYSTNPRASKGLLKSNGTIWIKEFLFSSLHFNFTSSNRWILLAVRTKFAPKSANLYANISPIPDDAPVIHMVFKNIKPEDYFSFEISWWWFQYKGSFNLLINIIESWCNRK